MIMFTIIGVIVVFLALVLLAMVVIVRVAEKTQMSISDAVIAIVGTILIIGALIGAAVT